MKNIILGAGITGLAAGIKTGFPIYEAGNEPGGICRSYYKNGYRFEVGGGHWIFGAEDKAIEFLKKYAKFDGYKRKAGILYNTILPYPIQNLMTKEEPIQSVSMKEDLREKFGPVLCNMFFYPFNNKYTEGLYEHVIQDDERKSPIAGSVGYNDVFAYPQGGLDQMIDKMAEDCTIHYNKKAIWINQKEKTIMFSGGEKVKYDRLISTVPLNQLYWMMLSPECVSLPYTSVAVMNIGAKRGKNTGTYHWLYMPYTGGNYYRVGFYSNVDPSFAPEGKVSIYVEGHTPFDEKAICAELQELGFIGDIETKRTHFISVAYTWLYPDTERDRYLLELRADGIESIGRYGKWKFQGISESILDGLGVEC